MTVEPQMTENDVAPMTYVVEGPPPFGQPTPVAPGIYWLRMPLPFKLDHINLWILEDGDGWTLIDCGIADQPTKDLWQAVFADFLGDAPAGRLIVTHFHPDHAGLAASGPRRNRGSGLGLRGPRRTIRDKRGHSLNVIAVIRPLGEL